MDWKINRVVLGSIHWGLMLILSFILFSAIMLSIMVQYNRSAYRKLQYSQQKYHELQIEQGQLLLEYGMLSNYQRIEKIAHDTLNMNFPTVKQIRIIQP